MNNILTPEEAKRIAAEREVLRELAIRGDFYSFCQYMNPEFYTENKPHLKTIAEYLKMVLDGTISKLMISLPPRGGKSYTASLFCAYALGRYPKKSVMRNTYGGDLAMDFSENVMDIIKLDRYLEIFPEIRIRKDRAKVNGWQLVGAPRPSYFGGGVGGAITGKGCDLAAIMDDPFKNFEEAYSPTFQKKTWRFYTSVHHSRMEAGCAEILIGTRWSSEDVHGQALKYNKGNDWTQLVIPALNSRGESYCEEIHTTQYYYEIKAKTETSIWQAEYMQNPTEAEGKLFPASQLRYFDPTKLRDTYNGILFFCDTATSGDDYLAGFVAKMYANKTGMYPYLYVTDVIFTQDDIPVTVPQVVDLIQRKGVQVAVFEANGAGHSYAYSVSNALKQARYGCSVKEINNYQNKEVRILTHSEWVKHHILFSDDIKPGTMYDGFITWLDKYVKHSKNEHDDAPDVLTDCAEWVRGVLCHEKPYVDKFRKEARKTKGRSKR